MTKGFANQLVCPIHGKVLTVPEELVAAGVPWPDSGLQCPTGCTFPVINGIPRFADRQHYANAFGLQWRRYQRTQLDSYTGISISRTRLERCLGMPLAALESLTVLECGAGAGRFTELLVRHARTLVAVDLSDAVDANLKNCSGGKPYLLAQADLNHLPLPLHAFDVVICLGVLQHTPSPEQSIASLAQRVKPGGLLVIDHYQKRTGLFRLAQYISVGSMLRPILKRLSPELGLRATIALSAFCDPIRRQTSRFRILDLLASRVLPTASYYGQLPGLSDAHIREWNELDTHDGLTDWYKHRRTRQEVGEALEAVGLRVTWCELGGNGIEARAKRHAQ